MKPSIGVLILAGLGAGALYFLHKTVRIFGGDPDDKRSAYQRWEDWLYGQKNLETVVKTETADLGTPKEVLAAVDRGDLMLSNAYVDWLRQHVATSPDLWNPSK